MRTAYCYSLLAALPLALACAGAARADSGIGVDTWRANKLDPTAGATVEGCDPRGMSYLVEYNRRTPTGYIHPCPPPLPHPAQHGDWQYHGVLQLGYLYPSGDDDNALWTRFAGWDQNIILGLLWLDFTRPADGTYASVRGSRISSDDQFYEATFGRAGSYKVKAFLRDAPNTLSTTAKSIWNGVGSNVLTLPSNLTPGASSAEDVAATSAALAEGRLAVKRSKQGLGFSAYLTPQWTAFADLSNEQRKGARPYGGSFFFNYPFPDNGGALETVKPIDDSTVNLNAGLRYAGSTWRMDFSYSGSFYRDRYTRYTFEMPFALWAVVPGSVAAPLTTGQMSMEPDNDYHNLKASVTRSIPLDGEFSLTASAGRMSQNDTLIAPIDCQGVFGIGLGGSLALGPQNPFLFDCSEWNTPAALSRRSGDLRIDTSLVDARIHLRPRSDLTLRGGLRFNRDDYRGGYLALNPLNGVYGYVAENGSQGSVVPGEVGMFFPWAGPSAPVRVRSLPLDLQTIDADIGADWRLDERNTLGVTLSFNRFEPSNRERQQVDDHRIKLSWSNRALDWLTLRANYSFRDSNGDRYDYDPYHFIYSTSLPGFIPPPEGVPSHTVEAMRKYDLPNRNEHKLNLMATFIPHEQMTLSASLRVDRNRYKAEIGRQNYDTYGATLEWDWQPHTSTDISAYIAWDKSRLGLANVQDQQAGAGVDPRLGGPNYARAGMWWLRDHQRNLYGGIRFNHQLARARIDGHWDYISSRGIDAYTWAGSSALAYPDVAPGPGPGGGAFPTMSYRVQSINLGVTFPFNERISMRIFDYYERGRINDWHYAGFDGGLVYDHRVYTDGGPRSYSANLVGLLLNVRL